MAGLRHLLIGLVALAVPVTAGADERILQYMEERYTHALLRDFGPEPVGEPEALGRADCTGRQALDRTQTNLARRLGRAFERAGIHIDLIATSRWCQAITTAQLLKLRPVTEEPALNALISDSDEAKAEAAAAILDLLDGLRPSETALLVTHGSNIAALTERASEPGEVIVVRLRPGKDLEILGSFRIQEGR